MSYLILDVESVVDDDLIYETSREIELWDDTTPQYESRDACLARVDSKVCTDEAKARAGGNCFIPLRFHRPVLVSMLLVGPDLRYIGYRTHYSLSPTEVVRDTWDSIREAVQDLGVERIITFNGKRFDLPLLELWAMRMELFLPFWFRGIGLKVWENPRTLSEANPVHIDLTQILSGSGFPAGDLHYWSRTMGLPGKIDTSGGSVAALVDAEKWDHVEDYCLCDCLNTLGIFMGVMATSGMGPGARSDVFEHTMNAVINARRDAGTTSQELVRFWKLFDGSIPF